jgi:phosphoribosylamine-glycine ligase
MMIAVRRSRGVSLSNAGRVYALERLTAALARSAAHIRQAQVSVSDANGPKGGVDKTCSVTVTMTGGRPVTVTHTADSVTAAVDGASRRAGHAVGRLAEKFRNLFHRKGGR